MCEEFTHATTAALRPSQLYPLNNYFAVANQLPDVPEFRDIVEAVHVAMWPLARDKPLTERNLPDAPRTDRLAGLRILRLAENFAEHAAGSVAQAKRDALWALNMFMLYVVPAVPNQCHSVLNLLEQIGPTPGWFDYPTLFAHLIAAAGAAIEAARGRPYPFLLAAPSEPHRNVAIMLDSVAQVLDMTPSRVLPILPSVLSVATLGASSFLPLVWMREHGGRIGVWFEIWDQSTHQLAARRAVVSEREELHRNPASPVIDCPTERFHRTCIELAAKLLPLRGPAQAVKLIESVLDHLPGLLPRFLTAARKFKACPRCQAVIGQSPVQKAGKKICRNRHARTSELTRVLMHYPAWLLSGGVEQIGRNLSGLGIQQPVCAIGNAERAILWRAG